MASQPAQELVPARKNAIARLIGVFTDPKDTFADIGARPSWLVPMLVLIVVQLAYVAAIIQRIGWESIARQQVEQSAQTQNMSAEQMQQAVEMGSKMAGIFGYVGVLVGVPVVMTIMAVVLMGSMNLVGGRFNFKQSLGIVSHASLIGVVATVLSLIVLYAKSAEDFDMQNPLAFNLGAFMSSESPKWLLSLAGSIDLFSFWSIALLATGFAAASGKLKFSKALTAVVLPWVVWVVVKVGWTAIRS